MRRKILVRACWCGVGLAAILAACQSEPAEPTVGDAPALVTPTMTTSREIPAPGQSLRVGGDMAARTEGHDGDFRAGPCVVDTPLPQGYPAPTPPGAIDLKSYPAARLAVVQGSGNPDAGKNRTFWPLFNHIKRHDIAMTSPVEMSYTGLSPEQARKPEAWSMAFLYRSPDMNAPGQEGDVTVRDAPPVTVLSIGLRGDYSMALVEKGIKEISEFLDANPQWRPAGEWRTLYYNGPAFRFWNKWAEVQVPVRPVESTSSR